MEGSSMVLGNAIQAPPVYDECALLNSRAHYHTAPFTITSDHATFVAS